MIKPNIFVILFAILSLAACVQQNSQDVYQKNKPPSRETTPKEPVLPRVIDPNERILSRLTNLPRQPLEDGACGLFLWSRVGTRQLLVLSQGRDMSNTVIGLDNTATPFTVTLAEGASYYGFYQRQNMINDELKVALTLQENGVEAIPQGARIRRASLNILDREGYELSLPVAGLIACKLPSP